MASDEYVVDFPTLGFLVADWIEAHCPVPKGRWVGRPFVQDGWQLWCTVNHYRIKTNARWVPEEPILGPAFHNRRSQVMAPQKTGKGPWAGATSLAEARGPTLFAGWARAGEAYQCSDHQCDCGFVYEYEVGEPKGMHWPTPNIQIFAASQDQVDNTFDPLRGMVQNGPLSQHIRVGLDFARIGEVGQIASVTSSALSRLGNPITFAIFDESGTYTDTNKLKKVARTARRGLAGMGGRSIETTNMFDPVENSTAQETFESPMMDVFKFYREPPAGLDFKKKADRAKILRHVYQDSPWVDLEAIEAEAKELMLKDPQEAERFFGNIRVAGKGSWMPDHLWENTLSLPEGGAE